MKKYFGFLAIALSVSITSCDKNETIDGDIIPDTSGETVTDVYGCIDENAINYDDAANMDNGSCEYSVAYLASGDWIISHIEYDTEIDLSTLGIGMLPIAGESDDAGAYSLSIDNSYISQLSFTTEPITLPFIGDLPGFPLDLPSEGTWALQNNEEEISFVDTITGAEQLYSIENLTQEFALLRGSIVIIQEIPTLGLYEFLVEIELTLEK